jgi:L-lactate dehydrogenase complex protein LldF
MANRPRIDQFAANLRAETGASVRAASISKTTARIEMLAEAFEDPNAARAEAARRKDRVLDNLGDMLVSLEAACQRNGIIVHWASDAAKARTIILEIGRKAAPQGGVIAKAKSMATEEIHLNAALEEGGYVPVETDLGEYVIQIDGDRPSHIVAPIIHKNRFQVARSFEREGLGPYSEDPATLTLQARAKLRSKFQEAVIGVSGINFAIAETGRLILVENEGNNRYSTTAPPVHIALMGIEKVLEQEADLPLFLKLLAGSATGQRFTTYVHLISGPRREDEPDGPREVHLVLLDNGRSKIHASKYRSALRCIRCGACLFVCPVYRQASGHGYRHVYSGPIGAVLAPLLEGLNEMGDLAKASSLCGACQEACPVQIPLPEMLLELRDEGVRSGALKDKIPWKRFADGASSPILWRAGLTLLPLASRLPAPGKSDWTEFREAPKRIGRDFRGWWDERS